MGDWTVTRTSRHLLSFHLMVFLFFTCVFTCASLSAHAQGAAEQAADDINRILNIEEERREQELRQLRDRQRTHTVIPSQLPPEQDLPTYGDQTCFDISEIVVDGVSLLAGEEVQRITGQYLGKCLGIGEINSIVGAITGLYVDRGYITSRAYIPTQNLRSGILRIEVIEGFVEAIRVDGGPARLAAMAWPGVIGVPLNLRRIEQGLDQINRLSSALAKIDFIPGTKVGGTIILVNYKKNSLVTATIGRNNSGQPTTGEQQIAATLEFNSPLGVSDHLYVTLQADTKDDHQGMKSESAGFNYTMPYGYWTFTFGANRFEYLNRIRGANTTFLSHGANQGTRINVRRLLFRDQNQKISATGLIKHQASENFIEDVKLDTSSVDYLAAEIGIDYEHYLSGSKTLVGGLAYSRAVGSSGSRAQQAAYPDAFQKLNLDVTYSDSIQWLAGIWRWNTGVHGQQAKGDLFGPESFSIGSQYTVRGFKDDGLSDKGGAYWRNEISATYFPVEHNPRFYITPYLAADAGIIDSGDSLSGWGVGLRAGGEYFRSDISYSRPLASPTHFDKSKSVINFSFVLTARW